LIDQVPKLTSLLQGMLSGHAITEKIGGFSSPMTLMSVQRSDAPVDYVDLQLHPTPGRGGCG